MFELEAFLIIVGTIVLIALVIWKHSRKYVVGTLAVIALILGFCAIQDVARAEELPQNFYYRVVFLDGDIEEYSVEEVDGKVETTYFVHGDGLDETWDFYEIKEENEENETWELNEDLSDIAKRFIKLNNLWFEETVSNRITLGRIVVLTMWECDPLDPFDDEVVDTYFSEYITNIK